MYYIELDKQRLPLNNIFCIGRNYSEHIKELGNDFGEEPLVFMKPTQSILYENEPIVIPYFSKDLHYECEIVIYIAHDATDVKAKDSAKCIGGIGIGLDLTARDIQEMAKNKGQPWLKAKGFKGAACISRFISINNFEQLNNIEFSLAINNKVVQSGNTKNMIYPIVTQIEYLSQIYGLKAGDIIYTGTPEGVGQLKNGDKLQVNLANIVYANWIVTS